MAKVETRPDRVKLSFDPSAFPGTYHKEGNSGIHFLNPQTGLLLKLCERKEYTALRPRLYLMKRDASGFHFLTSLYPKPNGEYTAEIQRIFFSVSMMPDGLMISGK